LTFWHLRLRSRGSIMSASRLRFYARVLQRASTFVRAGNSRPLPGEAAVTAVKAANHVIGCPQQRLNQSSRLSKFRRTSSVSQLVGVVGGLVLAAGVAAPLLHIPIAGTISYLRHPSYMPGAYNAGTAVLLGAAGFSIVSTIVRRFKPLWLTGTVALAQLGATLICFQQTAATVVAHAEQPDLVDPMLMWAGAALQRAHLEWGVGVIAVGALMILAAAAWDLRLTRQQKGGDSLVTAESRP
jgi:hypothetical protein